MHCPYCQQEMQKGTIVGYREPVEWHQADNLHDIFWDSWARKGVRLSESDSKGKTKTEAFRCVDCKIVIIPMK